MVPGPPFNSPRFIVPPLRMVTWIWLLPRSKLALALPVLTDVLPLLNRRVPLDIRPELVIPATIKWPVKLFIEELGFKFPPIVIVVPLLPTSTRADESKLLMMTVPLPDHA